MNQIESPSDLLKALPLPETNFLILVSLQNQPGHGYALMKDVEALSQGRVVLSTGTMYSAIKPLLGEEWIRHTKRPGKDSDGRGRKYYALTERGWQVPDAETQRLRELVGIAGWRLVPGISGVGIERALLALYAGLLKLYLPEFQRDVGAEMRSVFSEALCQSHQGRLAAALRLIGLEMVHLLESLLLAYRQGGPGRLVWIQLEVVFRVFLLRRGRPRAGAMRSWPLCPTLGS